MEADNGEDLQDADFLLPVRINIPSEGDRLHEGNKELCVAGEVRSPSEFYLVTAAKFFFGDIDDFIQEMTAAYHKWIREPEMQRKLQLTDVQLARPGSFVACINPCPDAQQERELVRGKILYKTFENEREFYVLLIDLGTIRKISLNHMFLLHKRFTDKPGLSIKCRFYLDLFYDKFHYQVEKWSDLTNRLTIDILKLNKRLKIRFEEKVDFKDPISGLMESVWEVAILKMEQPHSDITVRRHVEIQIIEKTMGSYVNSTSEYHHDSPESDPPDDYVADEDEWH